MFKFRMDSVQKRVTWQLHDVLQSNSERKSGSPRQLCSPENAPATIYSSTVMKLLKDQFKKILEKKCSSSK